MDLNNPKSLNQGMLIVFEGIDGTGKSTQLELLADYLTKSGFSVVKTKEPTEGTYGKQIRELYINRDEVSREEELELFLKDRRDHVEKLITPNLNTKKIILCDRYFLSTIAYQGAAGFDVKEIAERNAFAPKPDIALLFQLDPESSIQRITQGRGDTLNDFEQEDSLRKVSEIFESMTYPYLRKIDAHQSIEVIHNTVRSIVFEHISEHLN